MKDLDNTELMRQLTRRYGTSAEALRAVLCPLLIPISSLDKRIFRNDGEPHHRATFIVEIDEENRSVLRKGRTGKFVPAIYAHGQPGWREIAKGRITDVDYCAGIAQGEIYDGGNKKGKLRQALEDLTERDYLEIDQYGAAPKVLSGLVEFSLVKDLSAQGYRVLRMPEDMARHLGHYPNFDFEVFRNGESRRVEVKSLWGTNTNCARLIHSKTKRPRGPESEWTEQRVLNYYPTSSCKFATQDIFAVSLFLRTGQIDEFLFARSVPRDERPHGLPRTQKYPCHVHQNPPCEIGDGTWFGKLDEVWNLP